MKKLISLTLAVCVLLGCLLPMASAAEKEPMGRCAGGRDEAQPGEVTAC